MGMDLTLERLGFFVHSASKIDHIIWRYSFVYLFKSPVSFKEVLLTCLVIFSYKSVTIFLCIYFQEHPPKADLGISGRTRLRNYMWVFPLHHWGLSKRT